MTNNRNTGQGLTPTTGFHLCHSISTDSRDDKVHTFTSASTERLYLETQQRTAIGFNQNKRNFRKGPDRGTTRSRQPCRSLTVFHQPTPSGPSTSWQKLHSCVSTTKWHDGQMLASSRSSWRGVLIKHSLNRSGGHSSHSTPVRPRT